MRWATICSAPCRFFTANPSRPNGPTGFSHISWISFREGGHTDQNADCKLDLFNTPIGFQHATDRATIGSFFGLVP